MNDTEYASYNGKVMVDFTSLNSGTNFPLGTTNKPVNNLNDARYIAAQRNIKIIKAIDGREWPVDFSEDFSELKLIKKKCPDCEKYGYNV